VSLTLRQRFTAQLDRVLLSPYSREKLEELCPEDGNTLKEGTKAYDERRKQVSKCLDLDILWIPRVYRQEVLKDPDGRCKAISYLPNGQILRVNVHNDVTYLKSRWVYPRQNSGVKSLDERIKKLSFLIHVIVSHGFNPVMHRSLQRLLNFGFTTHIQNFRKLVRKIARSCKYRYDITRNPTVLLSLPQPSFMERNKSKVNLGYNLRLWRSNCKRLAASAPFHCNSGIYTAKAVNLYRRSPFVGGW